MSPLRAVMLADDLSGATDCQARLWPRFSSRTRLPEAIPNVEVSEADRYETDVLLLDTETRFAGDQTTKIMHAALRRVAEIRAHRPVPVYLKVDSTLRGDIGQLVALAAHTLKATCIPVVLANPSEGRVTREGRQYIEGTPVEHTFFATDPVHPVTDSLIRNLFDTGRFRLHVGNVSLEELRSGEGRVLDKLRDQRGAPAALVFDAVSQEDLERIALIIKRARCTLICGSAGLVGHLKFEPSGLDDLDSRPLSPRLAERRLLIVCGSLNPVATAQINALHSHLAIPISILPDSGKATETGERLADVLQRNRAGIVMSERLRDVATPSASRGESIAQRVAEVVREADRRIGIEALVVIGGRTAYHVCRQLQIAELDIKGVIAPNLPLFVSAGRPERLLVLKPGGFGDANLLVDSLGPLLQD